MLSLLMMLIVVMVSFSGKSLLQELDALPKIVRMLDVPLRMPITARFKVCISPVTADRSFHDFMCLFPPHWLSSRRKWARW